MTHSAPVALNLLDPHSLLASAGVLGVFLILFAETGLLIGFFLPGDSLLFTAGLLCATGSNSTAHLSLGPVLIAAAAGAVVGAEVGYFIGRQAGHALLDNPARPRLREGTRRAGSYIERYGVRRAVVLARFIPVVRTVLNPLAGAIGIPVRTFTIWQVVGGLVWSVGVTLAGFELGSRISNIDHYLLPIIAVIVLVSLIPIALELLRSRKRGPGDGAGDGAGHDSHRAGGDDHGAGRDSRTASSDNHTAS
jgi:membrane-associated protein